MIIINEYEGIQTIAFENESDVWVFMGLLRVNVDTDVTPQGKRLIILTVGSDKPNGMGYNLTFGMDGTNNSMNYYIEPAMTSFFNKMLKDDEPRIKKIIEKYKKK